MPNYSFVIDSSFQPFTFEDFLKPWNIYSSAYKEAEDAYQNLSKDTNTFEYLRQLPENSEARQVYERYANDLAKQAASFEQNGLNIDNGAALTGLRRRYQGEIGMLVKADEELKKVQDLRMQTAMKDGTMIYNDDNLNIDKFLYGKTPNLYGISGNTLYERGVAAAKADSSRYYSSNMDDDFDKYYKKFEEEIGISADNIELFMASKPVQDRIKNILSALGASQNLEGDSYARAYQSVYNGIYDGIVYQKSAKPVRNEGQMSAYQGASLALQRDAEDNKMTLYGYKKGPAGWEYDASNNAHNSRAGGAGGAGGSRTVRDPRRKTGTYFVGSNGVPKPMDDKVSDDVETKNRALQVNVKPAGDGSYSIQVVGPDGKTTDIGSVIDGVAGLDMEYVLDNPNDAKKSTEFNKKFEETFGIRPTEYEGRVLQQLITQIQDVMDREGTPEVHNFFYVPDRKTGFMGSSSAGNGGVIDEVMTTGMSTNQNTPIVTGVQSTQTTSDPSLKDLD